MIDIYRSTGKFYQKDMDKINDMDNQEDENKHKLILSILDCNIVYEVKYDAP